MTYEDNQLIGKYVTWNQSGLNKKACITSYIAKGKTSYVFTASIVEDNIHTNQSIVVKVPKGYEELDEQFQMQLEKYVPEEEVISSIQRKQEELKMIVNVPYLFKGYILDENKAVLVMEYLRPEKRWRVVKWRESELCEAVIQGIRLFQIANQIGYINTDVKEENFYWIKNDNNRFVLLDWNATLAVNVNEQNSQNTLFQKRRDNLVTLLNIAYIALSGDSTAPNPLPDIDIPSSEKWLRCPRIWKRTMHDVRRQTIPDTKELLSRFVWYLEIIEKKENGLFNQLLDTFKDIENAFSINELEKIERMKDLFSVLPDNLKTDAQEFMSKIELKEKDQAWRINKYRDEVIHMIERLDISGAIKRLEELMSSTDGMGEKGWEFGKWYAIALRFKHMLHEKGMTSTNEAAKYVSYFQNGYPHVVPGENNGRGDEVILLKGTLERTTSIFHKLLTLQTIVNVPEKEEEFEKIQDELNALRKILPPETFRYVEYRLPAWDINSLHRESTKVLENKKKEEAITKIKTDLVRILSKYIWDYPEKEIDSYIHSINFDYESDNELKDFYRAHSEAVQENWTNALSTFGNSENHSKLQIEQFNLLISASEKWLSRLSDNKEKKIYRKALEEAATLIDVYKKFQVHYNLSANLKARLDIAQQAWHHENDLQKLKKCQEYKLEPFAFNQDDEQFKISTLISIAKLNERMSKLSDLKENIDSYRKTTAGVTAEDYEKVIDDINKLTASIESTMVVQKDVEKNIRKLDSYLTKSQSIDNDFKKKLEESEHYQKELAKNISAIRFLLAQKNIDQLLYSQQMTAIMIYAAIQMFEQDNIQGVLETLDISKPHKEDEPVEFISPLKEDDGNADISIAKHQSRWEKEQKKILDAWKINFVHIHNNSTIQEKYKKWIGALKQKDEINSRLLMKELSNDIGKPFYEYLCNRQSELFSAKMAIPESEQWEVLYLDGNLEQLKTRISSFEANLSKDCTAKNTTLIEVELKEWKDTIFFTEMAIDLQQNNKGKKSNIDVLKRMLIPAKAWIIARNIISREKNTSNQ